MILNDPHALRQLDSLGSLAATEDYPSQFALGLELAADFSLPPCFKREYHEILVLAPAAAPPSPAPSSPPSSLTS